MRSLVYFVVGLALCGSVRMSPAQRSDDSFSLSYEDSDSVSLSTADDEANRNGESAVHEEAENISIPATEGAIENISIPVDNISLPFAGGEDANTPIPMKEEEANDTSIPVAEGTIENHPSFADNVSDVVNDDVIDNGTPIVNEDAENVPIPTTEGSAENSSVSNDNVSMTVVDGDAGKNTSTSTTEGDAENASVSVTEENAIDSVEAAGPKLAEPCNERCQLPDCRCSSTELSANISIADTPQFVMLTFDDAVTALHYEFIESKILGRRNPDGCPMAATFYVSHEYTDYSRVHRAWAAGHEIALHSITHNYMAEHWRKASVEQLVQEFGEQREMMAHFGKIDIKDIKGMRVPQFELSGNNSFQAMLEVGLEYDSSWPTQEFIAPGLWPYTLDYKSTQDCPLGRCPTASMKNAWVLPISNWVDTEGHVCAMVDACNQP